MTQTLTKPKSGSRPKNRDGAAAHRDSGAVSHDSNLARPLNPSDKLLPHERDQGPDQAKVSPDVRAPIEQAATDVRRGLRDTERRGTPSDVPAPGNDPADDPANASPESQVDMSDRPPGARR